MLTTERLILRPHALSDFPAVAAMWGDPAVTRHIGAKPSTREEAWARLLRNAGHWRLLGFGYWAVEEKATGAFLGEIGFANLERALEPGFGDAPEMGWVFSPAAQGKGCALEAGRAALAWGDAHFGRVRMVCLIAPENARSIRLAQKLGFSAYAHTTYKGEPSVLFERLPRPP